MKHGKELAPSRVVCEASKAVWASLASGRRGQPRCYGVIVMRPSIIGVTGEKVWKYAITASANGGPKS